MEALTGFYQTALAMVAMALVGRAAVGGRHASACDGPGLHVMAGWGVLCLVLTLWGVLTDLSMRLAAAAFVLAGVAALVSRRWRDGGQDDLVAVGRMIALAGPLLWVMADIEASQLDILALMLPNAAYLADHAAFPTALGPPVHSDAPVAPYHTEFAPFLGSLAGGGFAANGLSLFTVFLHLAAALLFARIVADDARPGWRATALGLALATVVNPGFVPRISFAGYGEGPLAISLMFAGWLAARVMADSAAGRRWPAALPALALVLVALVGIKQQAIGLFAAMAVAMLATAITDSRIGWRSGVRVFGAAMAPAAGLYLVWRGYVLTRFPDGELKSLPLSEWQWDVVPLILSSMSKIAFEKPYYFSSVILVFILFIFYRRMLGDNTRRIVTMTVAVFIAYTCVLVLIYVGHFRGLMGILAHSYFRYNTQLSLLIVLALVLAARDLVPSRGGASSRRWRVAGSVVIAVMLAAPPAFSRLLRFDQDWPQPRLRFLARSAAAELGAADRVLLVLPGDNTTIGMALGSLLRFAPPRRAALDLAVVESADAAVLAKAAADGWRLALLSCTDRSALDLPPGGAALLAWSEDAGGWRPLKVWAYPPAPARTKWNWTGYIAQEPLCF